MSERKVWIVDDDSSIRWVLGKALGAEKMQIQSFESADDVLRKLETEQPDVIITDIRMPGTNGLELLKRLQDSWPQMPVILMTAHTDLDSAVSAYQGGAFEYLPKPFDIDDAVSLVSKALDHVDQSPKSAQQESSEPGSEIIGAAPAMQEVFRIIGRLSKSNMSVLIRGESGTGKELVAQALFQTGNRSKQPFVALNTAAIPAELLESELFGHEKGAFTGAQNRRTGRFEQANGGTLFLDEIGDMPADLQTRLLRVLSDNSFYRVGGHEQIRVDVRIIAATNQDLETRVADGRFREDLFHRLNVISIQIPPLRERREDIPLLSRRFLEQAARELDVDGKQLSTSALSALVNHQWPGNVRQLQNACRRLTVMAPGQTVGDNDLPEELRVFVAQPEMSAGPDWEQLLRDVADGRLADGQSNILDQLLQQFESALIQTALQHTQGHKQEAAKRLGWGRNTLSRKIRELKLH
ncbi:MAG: two-component system nitrogen regulation response regulator GlnG [Parasphingorhabdus sp.]|jgi:two-component system nitrogen regulation response regulator GlnG